jgi:hypothetical protein
MNKKYDNYNIIIASREYFLHYLRSAVHKISKHWRRSLPDAEFWFNLSYHLLLNGSPFKAHYGSEPNLGGMIQ